LAMPNSTSSQCRLGVCVCMHVCVLWFLVESMTALTHSVDRVFVCVLMIVSMSETHKVKLKHVLFCNVYVLLFVESDALKTFDCATFKMTVVQSRRIITQ